ncbi:MAG: hypothetical protein P8X74_02620 [Reinekea sp.]|jgi:hypothetical protein
MLDYESIDLVENIYGSQNLVCDQTRTPVNEAEEQDVGLPFPESSIDFDAVEEMFDE